MEIGQLYQFVLVIALVALIVGVSILVLDKFSQTSGVTPAAQTALNASRDAISTVSTDWLGIIVVIGALAVILFLIIRSFGGQRR